MEIENVFNLWAKTEKETGEWHSLLWHLIDSGLVARNLWEYYLSSSFKTDFAQCLGLDMAEAGRLISFWVSLHDIGKAGPEFQKKFPAAVARLQPLGFNFPKPIAQVKGYHGLATTWVLRSYFPSQPATTRKFYNQLSICLGGHHGDWPLNRHITSVAYQSMHLGDATWAEARTVIIDTLRELFHPPESCLIPELTNRNTLFTLLTGLTTTADWIASNSKFFKFHQQDISLEEYLQISEEEARQSLEIIGWGGWKPGREELSFTELFPFQPNTMQSVIIETSKKLKEPFLMIIEAPTGTGKTEAALYLTDVILQRCQKSGFYIAMPTQATSNQMADRTLKFLSQRYPQDQLNFHLVHGAALIDDNFSQLRFGQIEQDAEKSAGGIVSKEWFLPRKKTMLAPFGVGTTDQTFMAVLGSKHFYLRLFGLSHKVIIFDEVHAYDIYMATIFRHLLSWLRAVGTSVILLSATLPESSRQELLQAYAARELSQQAAPFPRLSLVTEAESKTISLGKTETRSIAIDWLLPERLGDTLKEKLEQGGCVAVFCNRVRQAQEIYSELQQFFPAEELLLFHSRFPYCTREEIEKKVLRLFGKDRKDRPARYVVVATQVIEQSLDLDFDMIVSALAPVDLLIQRIGRLHRHKREKTEPRPHKLHKPACLLLQPQLDESGFPDFKQDGYIYPEFLLSRTHFRLRQTAALCLPAETNELINSVYNDKKAGFIPHQFWPVTEDQYQKMISNFSELEDKAKGKLIPRPDQNLLGEFSVLFQDEHDPQSHAVVHAMTRNARPSVQLVCIMEKEDGYHLLSDDSQIELDAPPEFWQIRRYLRSVVRIAEPAVVFHFFKKTRYIAWKDTPFLRTHYPLIFRNNIWQEENLQLVLDEERGILFTKLD